MACFVQTDYAHETSSLRISRYVLCVTPRSLIKDIDSNFVCFGLIVNIVGESRTSMLKFKFYFQPEMHEFFLTLSLCHTVHATEEEDNNAPYPYHYQV